MGSLAAETNALAAPGLAKLSFGRVGPVRNLADEVVERLTTEIELSRLAPGTRLPTETALMTTLGVSRTVVREAVAALRARGLVQTRQGAGAFVAATRMRPYSIADDGVGSLETVRQILELRLVVEIEAAALAASRGSDSSHRAIRVAHAEFEAAIGNGTPAVREDFAFHIAISRATGNKVLIEFLQYLGRHIIPRQSIRKSGASITDDRNYLDVIRREHEAIAVAIERRQPDRAREAMRHHLSNSATRYGKMQRDRQVNN